jgi:hypothetical protein
MADIRAPPIRPEGRHAIPLVHEIRTHAAQRSHHPAPLPPSCVGKPARQNPSGTHPGHTGRLHPPCTHGATGSGGPGSLGSPAHYGTGAGANPMAIHGRLPHGPTLESTPTNTGGVTPDVTIQQTARRIEEGQLLENTLEIRPREKVPALT